MNRGRGSLPYVPEEWTPLRHVPGFDRLEAEHRIAYNQLCGLAWNELIAFFETTLDATFLAALRSEPPSGLRRGMELWIRDERMHAAMFRRFNDAADPHPPGGRRRTRLDAGRHGRAVFRWLAGQPRLAPTFFLLVLIMEEKALALANAVGRRSRRPLDPRYVALHRVHRRDESEHVALGQRLVEAALERETPRGRRLNAVVARTLLTRWFLAPARGHDRILRRLIEEQPDAADRIAVLRTGVRGLGRTPEFMRRLYPRPVYPRTFALLDRWPVLHALRDRLESPGAEA